jgi:superfamily II DNA or RNA helicase
MAARKDSKIITFSKNVAMAEAIENGKNVYTGKVTKKKGRVMIEDFDKAKSGILHSCDKLNEGADLHGANVAIILGLDSSKTKATQRRGRVIRAEAGKHAEIFNLVINNTVELEWFKKSHKGDSYRIIDVHGLEQVLRGEEPDEYKKPIQKFSFRY